MKKIYLLGSFATLTLLFSGCVSTQPSQSSRSDIYKLDAIKVCKTQQNNDSIQATLNKARLYLKIAKKEHAEFRTRNLKGKYVSTSKNIKSVSGLIKKGDLKDATWVAYQSCVQSIRAVQERKEADKTYLMSVPK